MKFFLLFSFSSICLAFGGNAYAQNMSLNLVIENKSLADVLESIEQQSEFTFVYDNNAIDTKQRVSISTKNKNVYQVLDEILSDTEITYKVVEKKIILTPRVNETVQQSKITITGTIIDDTGEAIIGTSVREKGRNNGTITDIDGKFTLQVSEGAVLAISYIGYNDQEITVGTNRTFAITMSEDTQLLEEVVVVGYGTVKRKNFTGSVNQVKVENSPIALASNINALEALKGTTPGLDIGVSGGAGQDPSMQIRGQKSITGSSDPLIVLDGVVFLGSLRDIDPNTIASFDVLKDATSVAVYGSRAANGVINITTKKGTVGKPIINFNTSVGVQRWQQRPDIADPDLYVRSVSAKQGLPEDTDPIAWMSESVYPNYLNGKSTDAMDLIARNGLMQNYQVSISGGSEKMNYYLSTSYTDQEAPIVGDEFGRLAVTGKFDTKITNWLQIGVNANYTFSDYGGVRADIFRAMAISPYGTFHYDEDQKKLERYPDFQSLENPLWGTQGTIDDIETYNNFRVSTFAKIDIPWIPGLNYRFNWMQTGDFNYREQFTHEDHFIQQGYGAQRYTPEQLEKLLVQANGYKTHTKKNSYLYDHIINYSKELGQHFLDLTLVNTRDYSHQRQTRSEASDFANNGNTALGIDGLGYGTIQKISLANIKRANIGYLARLNYAFDDRYHFTASFRRDGASVFGAKSKWGNFPAVGLAWTATNESFVPKSDILNYLKLKLSWGKNGNQGVSPYGTLTKTVSGKSGDTYHFGNNPETLYGLRVETLGNALLGWESTSSLNTGFEASILKDRLSIDIDLYFAKTTDQLFERQLPPMTGMKHNKILESMGQVNNHGVEIKLNSVNIKSRDFGWNSSLIFALNRNKLKKLYGDDMDSDGREDDDIGNNLFIGHSLSSIYGYEAIGIVQETDTKYIEKNGAKPGDVMFRDLDGDEIITSADRKILGSGKENFKMSLSNTFRYKKFELYFMFSGTFGGNNYFLQNNQKAYLTTSNIIGQNILKHGWWTPENKSNKYPSPTYNDNKFLGLQNRGFVRLQDVTLSYTFESAFLKKMNLSYLKVFATGKNLFYITNWEGSDPERGKTFENDSYFVPTTYTFGVNVSF